MDAVVDVVPAELEGLLSSKEVAVLLGVSPSTLSRWRFEGDGPQYLKLGRGPKAIIRYRRSDVAAYLDGCSRNSTASSR